VHRVEDHPQFLSTNRHVMQGYLDMPGRPRWDAAGRTLSGTSDVIGGDPYKIVLACNGWAPLSATAEDATIAIEPGVAADGLVTVTLTLPQNARVSWRVAFDRAAR
jgi:hypothetical protein